MNHSIHCLIWLVALLGTLGCAVAVMGQNYDPPYPRVVASGPGGITFGETSIGAKPMIWAQYDLAIVYADVGRGGPEYAALLRQLNPDIVLLGLVSTQGVWPGSDPYAFHALHSYSTVTTSGVGPGSTSIPVESTAAFPNAPFYIFVGESPVYYRGKTATAFTGVAAEELKTSYPAGTKVTAPVRFVGFGMLPNLTDFCPLVEGKPAWQHLVDKRFTRADFTNFDGTAWDAFREFFYAEDFDDVDFDGNGANDFQEHGLDWINAQWRVGITNLLAYERQRFQEVHPTKPAIILVNCGGGGGERGLFSLANGIVWEGFMRFAAGWGEPWGLFANMQAWLLNGLKPSVYYIKDYVKEANAETGKNDFTYMRYGLTTALLGDGYYGRTFGDYYYISYWYDEFDTDLGHPTTMPHRLANGAYVRFFDKGAVICNPTGTTITVTDADLRSAPGYAGPYYRFRGGQDPEFNNGNLFASVQLYGWTADKPKRNRGDGILLFKEPTVAISDIIVGNYNNNDTSPGSAPASYVGTWVPMNTRWISFSDNNPYYTQWTAPADQTPEGYGYFVAAPGQGEATATYTPTIGVAGYYEVFEWHGWHGDTPASYQEASNVPYEVVVNGEVKRRGLIDQTTNYGQWNRLGLFYFPKGTVSYVRISNNANGYVISDAFRFVFRGTEKADTTPPAPPKGVRVERP
ncbi:MAG: putative glycoside hydrolase [candidate division KSB1 bacterium]|nr:putative glycoside hydrolase [candidate division KSB1 bacterium]MDZ7392536.1 putative glycoside hydrolase [candidate division KSB1 bacterium]MDZ7412364.1 putative glycoside hydrolase [candidate division KSB1 bacterium]